MSHLVSRLRNNEGSGIGLLVREAADRIEALEAALNKEGREVTFPVEYFLGAFRFPPGRYLIVKLDGPAPAPDF